MVPVTHSGKGAAQYYSDPLGDIVGSAGITAAVDWVLVMQRSEDGQAAMLYSDGKMGAASGFLLKKKNGIFFEIDGLKRDRLILCSATHEGFGWGGESFLRNYVFKIKPCYPVVFI